MGLTAIVLLLGVSSTAEATSHQTCVGYTCPMGWHPRDDLASLHCIGVACGTKDKGTCCLEGPAPPKTTTDKSPCAQQVPSTLPPTPPPTAAPKTCGTYTCPTGWQSKPNNGLIRCWTAAGCSAKDTPNCCLQVSTTTAAPPAPPTTAVPTPSPPVTPAGCKVVTPKDGFAPWHVYTIMKASTPKIDTAEKLLMGGQTLNMTGLLDIRSSKFHCEYADHEMRAVLDTGDSTPVATINVHNSLYPALVTTQCILTQISMYKSAGTDIPGLRLDYDDCPFGPAKKATLMIGLRKVPNNWGKTAGIAQFFKDVCPTSGTKGGDSTLKFNAIDMVSGLGCWAQSADYTLMTSERDCFEPAMIFTFMDAQNHFALFPVTDNEWEDLVQMIPKAKVPDMGGVVVAAAAPADSPCAPVVPVPTPSGVHVYGSILQNRMCLAMPELGCHNFCGKVCVPVTPQSAQTSTPLPTCTTCYDCEWMEMIYAVLCTIVAFIIANTIHKRCSGQEVHAKFWTNDIRMPDMPYSQLTQPKRAISRDTWCQACTGMFFLSFVATLIAFTLVNFIDYVIAVHWLEEEMCLKIFEYQNYHIRGTWWTEGSLSTCVNDVCFWRLAGLFLVVWMSLWLFFCYWRYHLQVTVEKQEIKRIEAKVEFGAGSGAGAFMNGGSSLIACTVQ